MFEVWISNGSVLDWSVIAIAIAMVPTILKLNHWISEQNGEQFNWISKGFGQNGHHFVQNGIPLENQMPLENQTVLFTNMFSRYWSQSKQTAN